VIRDCPVCGGNESVRKFEARDAHYGLSGSWWVRECKACQTLFLETLPPVKALEGMYGDDYYAYKISPEKPLKRLAKRLIGYNNQARDPALPERTRVLDFGCGAGEFLLRARERGWEPAGVEINEHARSVAQQQGLDVRPELTGPRGFQPESFDYVRANHSLEHVVDPVETLRAMWTVLKPGGTLFLGVPTASSENARLFGAAWWHVTAPLHTFIPSTHALKELVERLGFRIRQVSTNGAYVGTAGSLQILLNKGTRRRSNQGIVFTLRPLLLLGHLYAKVQDVRGVGDSLELTAIKPAA
jgi:2-polyprenyl-3-methyl-5-hydroxy-6-metoxy-1,4-benzoquinol methylase